MINLQTATVKDALLISTLGRNTFYETWRPVNTEEDMQSYMSYAFDTAKIKKDIENNSINTFLIAYSDDEAIGYAKMRRDRTYPEFKNDPVIEIERIYVLKKFQDKKIGKALMDECIKIARQQNYRWLWLGVNIDNLKAINFYKKYDFTIFGEKSFQLGEANDNDYLMKKSL